MTKNNRRNFVKLLPYVLVGGFTYSIGKFIFFSDNLNKKIALPLKNVNEGITYLKQNQTYIYKTKNDLQIFDAHCTHMGCIINFNQEKKQFNCPCHKSRFDIDGTKLRGPAKRDLDKVVFRIKNKTIYIG